MEMKKVWAMYFSPTGGTEKAVKTTAEALANQLANDANNVNADNATAFLCYVQKAVACK